MALRDRRQPTAGFRGHGEIAQVGPVPPQAGVQQSLEAPSGFQGAKLLPGRGQRPDISLHLPHLLLLERIMSLSFARLEIAHRLQQLAIEKGLGEVPRNFEPGLAGVAPQFTVPIGDIRGRLDQGLNRLGSDLVAEGLQGSHDRGWIDVISQYLPDDLRLAFENGIAREGARLGGHKERGQRQVGHGLTFGGHRPDFHEI